MRKCNRPPGLYPIYDDTAGAAHEAGKPPPGPGHYKIEQSHHPAGQKYPARLGPPHNAKSSWFPLALTNNPYTKPAEITTSIGKPRENKIKSADSAPDENIPPMAKMRGLLIGTPFDGTKEDIYVV